MNFKYVIIALSVLLMVPVRNVQARWGHHGWGGWEGGWGRPGFGFGINLGGPDVYVPTTERIVYETPSTTAEERRLIEQRARLERERLALEKERLELERARR